MKNDTHTVEELTQGEYKYGFVTDIEADTVPPGLNEDVIRFISAKKQEPEGLLDWRVPAHQHRLPKGLRCWMERATYFRINAAGTGQFERTLIVADEGAYVSYLEGCTAPMRDENQLHAAVVELVALEDATVKYSTIQNWYPGDKEGRGGIYNFGTKRGG